MCRVCRTLQGVEDGEQVHEGQADGPPGEQGEAPRHPEQEGEADDAPQVPQNLDPTEPTHCFQVLTYSDF